jgi:hypothetical protein
LSTLQDRTPGDPGSRVVRLGPWAFSVGGIDLGCASNLMLGFIQFDCGHWKTATIYNAIKEFIRFTTGSEALLSPINWL